MYATGLSGTCANLEGASVGLVNALRLRPRYAFDRFYAVVIVTPVPFTMTVPFVMLPAFVILVPVVTSVPFVTTAPFLSPAPSVSYFRD